MSTTTNLPDTASDDSAERASAAADAAFAHLHSLYRNDLGTLQVAIANATGDQRERLQRVLANLRSQKR